MERDPDVGLPVDFLDEGFGTLDADTLETVAATIESLGSTGRMVGVVTHVPALGGARSGALPRHPHRSLRHGHSGGRVKFTVDPWDPAYGSSLESDLQQSEATVVADLEVAGDQWAPRRPPDGTTVPAAVVFVDGVRRLEARAWIETGPGDAVPGIFASYAAGAVRCDGAAQVVAVTVGRGLYAPVPTLADVDTRHGVFVARVAA